MLNKCDGGGAVNMCSYILQNGSAYTRNGVGGCDLVGFACEPGQDFQKCCPGARKNAYIL